MPTVALAIDQAEEIEQIEELKSGKLGIPHAYIGGKTENNNKGTNSTLQKP